MRVVLQVEVISLTPKPLANDQGLPFVRPLFFDLSSLVDTARTLRPPRIALQIISAGKLAVTLR
jgi:hypothetical protein